MRKNQTGHFAISARWRSSLQDILCRIWSPPACWLTRDPFRTSSIWCQQAERSALIVLMSPISSFKIDLRLYKKWCKTHNKTRKANTTFHRQIKNNTIMEEVKGDRASTCRCNCNVCIYIPHTPLVLVMMHVKDLGKSLFPKKGFISYLEEKRRKMRLERKR